MESAFETCSFLLVVVGCVAEVEAEGVVDDVADVESNSDMHLLSPETESGWFLSKLSHVRKMRHSDSGSMKVNQWQPSLDLHS